MISAVVSSLHVLALAIGLPAVFLRGRALKGPLDADGVRRLLAADNVWGVAALLWIVTGLLRAFGGLEKGTEFYLRSPLFWTKMGLFLLDARARDPAHDHLHPVAHPARPRISRWTRRSAPGLYTLNHIELALVVVMVFVASMMARGVGF